SGAPQQGHSRKSAQLAKYGRVHADHRRALSDQGLSRRDEAAPDDGRSGSSRLAYREEGRSGAKRRGRENRRTTGGPPCLRGGIGRLLAFSDRPGRYGSTAIEECHFTEDHGGNDSPVQHGRPGGLHKPEGRGQERVRFILLDRILAMEKGRGGCFLKNVAQSEDFFTDHFPGSP